MAYRSIPESCILGGMSPTRLQLKELRAWKGWSQARLAQEAGIDRVATVSDYENGKVSLLNMATLEKLAAALGVQVGQLFVEERAPATKRTKRPS